MIAKWLHVPMYGWPRLEIRRELRSQADKWAHPGKPNFKHFVKDGPLIVAIFERTVH